MPTVGHGEDAPARPVAIRWSLRETRRRWSGGVFPGLEELVDDPPGGAPDDVVADCVVMNAVLLLAHIPRLGRVHLRIQQLGDRDHQQTLHLVRRQHKVIDAAVDQAYHGGDDKAADCGEDVVQLAEHRDARWFEADLLVAFAQGRRDRLHVRVLALPTREGDLALVSQHGVRTPREEHLDIVAARHRGNQHAGPDQRWRRVDSAPDTMPEQLAQPLEAGAGGGRQVHASNETGTWWPQWVHTQTWPRRVTSRPSSSRTDWSGPLIRSQRGMCLHWSQVGGGGLVFTRLDYPRWRENQAAEAPVRDSRRR